MNNNNIYVEYIASILKQSINQKESLESVMGHIKSDQHSRAIQQIRNAKNGGEKKQLKRKLLPAFRPTLTSKEQTLPTGIIQFDVDTDDNPELEFHELRNQVVSIPECIYAYSSPSNGLKFGIWTDFTKTRDEIKQSVESRYTQAYEFAKQYLYQQIDADFKTDDSVKSIN